MISVPSALVPQLHDYSVSIGRVLGIAGTAFLQLTCDLLSCHVVILGGTRCGKTKLIEWLIFQIVLKSSSGVAFVDPHGDGADDLFARLSFFFDRLGFRKLNLHVLCPRTRLFSIDLFAYEPPSDDPYEDAETAYRIWLGNRVETITRLILRGHTDTEQERQQQNRLARQLYNALYACGVRQDELGTHEPLSNLSALLNPLHPRHEEVYSRVRPYLEHPMAEDVLVDFETQLRRCRTHKQINDLTESSLNAWRRFYRGVVPQIIDNRCDHPTINFRRFIETNAIVLCSFGMDEDALSRQQSITLGGLFVYLFYEAARVIPKEERQPFSLVVDEASNLLDEDFDVILSEAAKFKLFFMLAVQHLGKLRKGKLDLLPAVLSQCAIRITFQQQFQEHAETLAKCFCYRQLDFTPLSHDVNLDNGIITNFVPSVSCGQNDGNTVNIGHTDSNGHTESKQETVTESTSEGESVTRSTQRTTGTGRTVTHGVSRSVTHGSTEGGSSEFGASKSHDVTTSSNTSSTDASAVQKSSSLSQARTAGTSSVPASSGLSQLSNSIANNAGSAEGSTRTNSCTKASGHADREGESESQSLGRNWSQSQQLQLGGSSSLGSSENESHMIGVAVGKTLQHGTSVANGNGSADQTGEADTVQIGSSRGESTNVSITMSPMRDVRTEEQLTGHLVTSVNDQIAKFTAGIMNLPKQTCLISIASWKNAVPVRVDDVCDPYASNGYSDAYRAFDVARVLQFIFATQPYYFRLSERKPADGSIVRPSEPTTPLSDQFFPEEPA